MFPKVKKPKQTAQERSESTRKFSREYQAAKVRAGQEIGDVPPVVNWARRERCIADPELFLRTYFGERPYFYTPFCADHRKVIAKFEDAIRNGGLFTLAMPRAHGKTTFCRAFAIRALACGFRRFAFIVGAAMPHARRSIDAIKSMMLGNTLYDPEKKTWVMPTTFAQDFPEIVYPAAALGRTVNRQKGQMCGGVPTDIHWSGDLMRLPRLQPSKTLRAEQLRCGGAILMGAGLLGSAITGLNIDGIRPDLLIPDDPQTRESAMKDAACAKREEIINAMVTGLAGSGVRIAAVMPVTVIREGDLADRFLSHALHPEWAIERTQLLHTMPTHKDLWIANRNIRTNYNPFAGPEDKRRASEAATMHYIDNQAAMDAGAEASWPERFNADEVSAIQNAMNLHGDNERAFFAEMQNQPMPVVLGNTVMMTAAAIAGKLSNVPRREVPHDATTLTAFIDVQKSMLFYVVMAFAPGFTGYVVDYGSFPDQRRDYFTLTDAPLPLDRMQGAPDGEEARIVWALGVLVSALMDREWPREKSGAPNKLDLCVIDSGYSSQLIYQFCRRSKYRILPSKGQAYHAGTRWATGEGKSNPGDKRGYHWHLPAAKEERGVKLLLYDAGPWKSFLHARLATPVGSPGCLSLFGDDPAQHRLFVDHILSEYCTRDTNMDTGKSVDLWRLKNGNPDNHWLDCVAGACVAGAVSGMVLDGVHKVAAGKRPARLSIAEVQAKREAERNAASRAR